MCNASIESFIQVCISFSYNDKLGAIYGDVMTKKHENWWSNSGFSSLIHRICSKWLVFENHKLVNVCWPSRSRSRSNRNLLTVACNCSCLVYLFIYCYLSNWNSKSQKLTIRFPWNFLCLTMTTIRRSDRNFRWLYGLFSPWIANFTLFLRPVTTLRFIIQIYHMIA